MTYEKLQEIDSKISEILDRGWDEVCPCEEEVEMIIHDNGKVDVTIPYKGTFWETIEV